MAHSSGNDVSQPGLTLEPLRVWVVDDNLVFRQSFTQWLEAECGFHCQREFGSAEELVAALRGEPAPQVILLDNGLPGLSGIEALPAIKRLAPAVPVILCSTMLSPQQERDALSHGAYRVHTKLAPFAPVAALLRTALAGENRLD